MFHFPAMFNLCVVGQSKQQQSTAPAPTVRPLQPQNGSDGMEINIKMYSVFICYSINMFLSCNAVAVL